MDRRLFLAGLPLLAAACVRDNTITVPKDESPTPAGPTPLPKAHEFEFRVNGTVEGLLDIGMSNSAEGTTLIRSDLPWFVTVKSTRTSMFLSLEAQSFDGFGTLTVQIFVDGELFREASSDGFAPRASISGQWHE
jgi:hypothetical protein